VVSISSNLLVFHTSPTNKKKKHVYARTKDLNRDTSLIWLTDDKDLYIMTLPMDIAKTLGHINEINRLRVLGINRGKTTGYFIPTVAQNKFNIEENCILMFKKTNIINTYKLIKKIKLSKRFAIRKVTRIKHPRTTQYMTYLPPDMLPYISPFLFYNIYEDKIILTENVTPHTQYSAKVVIINHKKGGIIRILHLPTKLIRELNKPEKVILVKESDNPLVISMHFIYDDGTIFPPL